MTPLDSEIVFYAFRYCLGRQTYAVSTCADYLVDRWGELQERDRELIVKEIRKALAEGKAGAACDVESWQSVLRRADENLSVRKGEA
ncbi:hypothetical protein [Fimbriiglobus ruber]|uniref:hypothetical protein n=1 Tax=Fimbriiglobus ruber TaxID=1908690 RepID=UPI000B4AFE04|nr:hypothetical protein [Fimbriiglobus ruber]